VYDAIISSNSSSFVNSLAYLSPNQPFPEGLVISGGKDTVIEVRQPTKGPEDNAEALLLGHGNNICALDVSLDGKYIVSGSWDSEARVWPVGKWEAEVVLKDHQGSVWGVLAFDSETVITGCADKLIRVWTTGGKLLRTIRGTEDCVRALCRIPKGHQSGADFASAGNDGKIRFWSLSGHQLGQFHAHDSYIYSLATSPSGEMFSSGEDRSVRVWKGTECQQTITHPAISVWDVAVCPENGDIVTGSSDRIVRVFTRDSARAADVETLKQFEDSVKQSSIPQQSLPDVNKEELPGPEFLTSKLGTKEGQVQMIREPNGSVTAHTWSAGKIETGLA
jgi:phospholipase A-2-activating protein